MLLFYFLFRKPFSFFILSLYKNRQLETEGSLDDTPKTDLKNTGFSQIL